MNQFDIVIGDVKVPIVEHEGHRYYPAAFIGKNILMRGKNAILSQSIKSKYKDSIIKFTIIFYDGVPQETNCIREDSLKEILSNTHLNRISNEKRIAQNRIHTYFNLKELPLNEEIATKFNQKWLYNLDKYVKEIFEYEINNEENLKFRFCHKCEKYLPLTNRFFSPDERMLNGYIKTCKECKGREYIHPDFERQKMRRIHNKLYEAMHDDQIEEIYEACVEGKFKFLPDCYQNKESYLRIIRYLYDKGKFTKDDITYELFISFKLNRFLKLMTTHDVYKELFGEEYYLYPWRYDKFRFGKNTTQLTYEIAFKVLKNYIKEYGIEIENPLTFKYEEIVKKSKVRKLYDGNSAEFIVRFNNFSFPSYYLSIGSPNYYQKEENVLHDLKFLIEQDMKLKVEKIPIYLTRNVLQKKANPLYYYIITKKNHSLYYWVNKLYPGKFEENDFDLNPHRLEFDSDSECFIDEILREEFKNVLYNTRRNDSVINLDGMMPDWFLFTDYGTVIVEYFGMYIETQKENSRIRDYIEKTDNKLMKYKNNIKGYEYLFLYPDDLEHDFEGVRKKVSEVKEKLYK